jgi:IS30 family transposase
MLVIIAKFTKWIEYTKITKLSADRVVDFICDILHHVGFPNTIITDLGSNFHSHEFWELCENSTMEVKYVSMAHPWANGQVERANGLILDGLKKTLYDENSEKGGKWIFELPLVIWGFTPNQPKPQYSHLSLSSTGQNYSPCRYHVAISKIGDVRRR